MLLFALTFCCVDEGTFPGDGDGETGQDAGGDAPLWPDSPPLPDGLAPPPGSKMYTHSQSQLFEIDPLTLQLSLVGTFGPGAPYINDLAVTPQGEVYVISSNNLYRADPKTAQLTWIVHLQGTSNVALTFEVKGTLLASDKSGALRRIDPATGKVQEIGTYGAGMSASGDLVAIKDGTLFGVNDGGSAWADNDLITVDPSTGKAKIIGRMGYSQVWGLAYWKGTVYGLTKSGDFLRVDPATGKGSLIKTYPYEFWGAGVTPLAPIK